MLGQVTLSSTRTWVMELRASASNDRPLMVMSNLGISTYKTSEAGIATSASLRNAEGHTHLERSGIIQVVGIGDNAPLRWIVKHLCSDAAQRIAALDQPCRKLRIVPALVFLRTEHLPKREIEIGP